MSKNNVSFIQEYNSYIFSCPHCNATIIVDKNDINCRIFRHGIIKTSNKQIDPHSPHDYCEMLVKNNLIYGCGKPFIFNEEYVEKCDYI